MENVQVTLVQGQQKFKKGRWGGLWAVSNKQILLEHRFTIKLQTILQKK
jgi:hypothetical protein